ncbi:MAG: 3',5'-cyclic-AMP phosphodiesterase [Gammaproteobacteria bacterium]
MPGKPLRIVVLTDTHLFENKEKILLGVRTQESHQAVIELLKSENVNPDIILHTGDLSQDGSEAAYLRLGDELSVFGVPIYFVPGNHDDSEVMQKVYPRGMFSTQKQLVHEGWQLILLDSHIPGKVPGYLNQTELDFLEKSLKQYPNHRAIPVFHHQPVAVGCKWLDKIGLTNADEFWELLGRFPQVHTILFGHVHQQFEGEKNNIKYYSAPSTCIQFKTKSPRFALDELAPGYRLIDLYPDGSLHTQIRRTAHYVGIFEPHAKGY